MRQASPVAVVTLTIRVVTGTIILAIAACDRGPNRRPRQGLGRLQRVERPEPNG